MKTGLVLEGGAMRGMYTAGALDVMMENEIVVQGVVGVSAGAVFGCNYKSGQIGRVLRYNTTYSQDPRFGGFRSLIRTGDFYGADFCYREIPEVLDPFDHKAFAQNPMEFYVTCTDVQTGRPVYKLCRTGNGEDTRWMQASASMPLVSRVVTIHGKQYLDGGISDSIPITWFRQLGYERNIVILTQPENYEKKPTSAIPLAKMALRKYPNLVEAMATRHERYNQSLAEIKKLKQQGEVLVLQPSEKITIKRTEKDPDKLRELYQLGRSDTMKKLDQLQKFVSSCE